MDKQEYKILSEEIMTLVANEQFVEAAEIADRIDWRKVRSFTMLQRISDLYKINRRFDEALDIILMAYDKNPNSKTIVYSICEIYLEMGDLITALQYMGIYNKMAPKDVGGAILKYKVLELEEAKYEDRIEQLEKIVAMSYQAEWAYQLAYMYHRMGLATKCVECCNQLISWFGNGPFVIKAMELKMLHEKLSPSQQSIYDHRNDVEDELSSFEGDEEMPGSEEEDFHVKTIDMSKFNTVNLQKALAESMRELMGDDTTEFGNTGAITSNISNTDKVTRAIVAPMLDTAEIPDETAYVSLEDALKERGIDPENQTNENVDESEAVSEEVAEEGYEDGNYSEDEQYEDGYTEEEYSDGEYTEDGYTDEGYSDEEYTDEEYTDENYSEEGYEEYPEDEQYGDGEVAEEPSDDTSYYEPARQLSKREAAEEIVERMVERATGKIPPIKVEEPVEDSETFFEDKTGDIVLDEVPLGMLNDLIPGVEFVPARNIQASPQVAAETIKAAAKATSAKKNTPYFDSVLSYDNDGQITLVVPEKSSLEKQITGQMNLQDVLAEWEKVKKKKEAQQNAEVKKNILERTGKIFEDYDEAKKNGILAQIDEEQKKNNKVLKSGVKTRSIEEIAEDSELQYADNYYPEEDVFDATAALNKTYGPNIWDEVNRSIEEDNAKKAASNNVASTAGAVVAGAAAGAVAGAAVGAGAVMAAETALPVEELAAGAAASSILGSMKDATMDDAPDYSESEDTYSAEEVNDTEEIASEAESDDNVNEEYSDDIAEEEMLEEEIPEDNEEEYTEEYSDEQYEDEYADYVEGEYEEEAYDENQPDDGGEIINTAQIGSIGSALEEAADEASADMLADDENDDINDDRDFSPDEQEIFEDFLYSKRMRAQILDAVDVVSMASYVGNVIISGESGTGVIQLAKAVIKEIQLIDSNFVSSKVAKISGSKMNQKDIPGMFMQLANGALIIEKAGKLTKETLENITRALENASDGIIVILTDSKKEIEKLVKGYDVITGYFNARIDILPMSTNALVEHAKKYAYHKEYHIDEERAVLTLHERISELQIGEHHVTTKEVEAIIDRAIAHSKKARVSAFVDILVAKRYDKEDMIILKEKDFEV